MNYAYYSLCKESLNYETQTPSILSFNNMFDIKETLTSDMFQVTQISVW